MTWNTKELKKTQTNSDINIPGYMQFPHRILTPINIDCSLYKHDHQMHNFEMHIARHNIPRITNLFLCVNFTSRPSKVHIKIQNVDTTV